MATQISTTAGRDTLDPRQASASAPPRNASRRVIATVIVMLTVLAVHHICFAQLSSPTSAPASDSSSAVRARAAVLSEVLAFYRDLGRRLWPAVLDHFWPAKVTARWERPDHGSAWAALDSSRAGALRSRGLRLDGSCGTGAGDSSGATEVHLVGRWARVRITRCAMAPSDSGERAAPTVDEFWLFSMNGRWKVVHLDWDTVP